MAIPQLCNLGLSGINFVGTDIGGFGSDVTKELLCRWIELGIFSPFCRNHSGSIKGQDPWLFDDETVDIYRTYVRLRYQWLPYLYDLFKETEENGLPMMRPLVLEYPDDVNVRNLNDEFLFGSSILVSPVVEQGQRYKMVYLPEGEWTDYYSGEKFVGPKHMIREAPLNICPIYIKAGSIIPNYEEQNYVGEKIQDTLILSVTAGAGHYRHYQDDGDSFDYEKGIYNLYDCSISPDGNFSLVKTVQNWDKGYKNLKILFEGKEYTANLQNVSGVELKLD